MTEVLQIFWIRHLPIAETGRYIGHTDVAAITPSQPATLPESLPENATWFASPLLRAIDSAYWLLDSIKNHNIHLQFAEELKEQNFGVWENRIYEEMWQEESTAHDWSNLAQIKPFDGESFAEVCERVGGWINSQLAKANGTPIVAIAHAGTIRAALCHALKIAPEQALSFAIDYASITQIDYFPQDNSARVACVNR